MRIDLSERETLCLCVARFNESELWRVAQRQFEKRRLAVRRLPGINPDRILDSRGYLAKADYAESLELRLAVRAARQSSAKALFFFIDSLAPNDYFLARLTALDVPEDWGLLLIATCIEDARGKCGGCVKTSSATEISGIVIRATVFDLVSREFSCGAKGKNCLRLSAFDKWQQLQRKLNTYALSDSPLWCRDEPCRDLRLPTYANSRSGSGRLLCSSEGVRSYQSHMENVNNGPAPLRNTNEVICGARQTPKDDAVSGWDWTCSKPRLHSFDETFPKIVYLNLSFRDDRRSNMEFLLFKHHIKAERFPAVSARYISDPKGHLGKGQYACALSHRLMLRAAKALRAPSVLIFEDDVELHPNFLRIVEAVPPPGDWGILYFGCIHILPPEIVGPGIVRVKAALATHAYAVRETYYNVIMRSMRIGIPGESIRECDVILSKLADQIPSYAYYPNIAKQSDGLSNITNVVRSQYSDDGRQIYKREIVEDTDGLMRECVLASMNGSAHGL